MSSKALSFPFENCLVRVAGTPERPMFVGKDICQVLGIEKHLNAIGSLDDDERGPLLVDTLGGKQEMTCLTESGLYHLIFKSRKVAAKRFRRWVTETVLPEIRKTGGYGHRRLVPDERLELLYKTKRLLLELNGDLDAEDRAFFSRYVHRLMLSQDPEAEAEFADGSTLTRFVVDCLEAAEGESLTTEELYAEYEYYCDIQQVVPQPERPVQQRLPALIWRFHRKNKRNDIVREDTSRRGYAGLGLKRTLNPEAAGSVLLAVGR